MVELILGHKDTGYDGYEALHRALGKFYQRHVLAKAGVPEKNPKKQIYSMRTIRAYRATEYIKLRTEYKVMGWSPSPPNPLQHTNDRMTLDNYAEKGSDNVHEARKRCALKYAGCSTTRLPWMSNYMVVPNLH